MAFILEARKIMSFALMAAATVFVSGYFGMLQ